MILLYVCADCVVHRNRFLNTFITVRGYFTVIVSIIGYSLTIRGYKTRILHLAFNFIARFSFTPVRKNIPTTQIYQTIVHE